ncbi:MAG: outer membrane protein assembly factor BamE [Candidatus Kapabacteria bacterium]|nr:outer membrane protein assembly factor BamE [Candidatus Kapabacteria bacterium]
MKKLSLFIIASILILTLNNCQSSRESSRNSGYTQEKELTVGLVQKEIKKGMSGAEVAEVLGSPNIVTKDDNGNETWVYDKIATEVNYSENQSSIFIFIGGVSDRSGSKTVTQKTLTVVIKFDDRNKVSSFSYHATKF